VALCRIINMRVGQYSIPVVQWSIQAVQWSIICISPVVHSSTPGLFQHSRSIPALQVYSSTPVVHFSSPVPVVHFSAPSPPIVHSSPRNEDSLLHVQSVTAKPKLLPNDYALQAGRQCGRQSGPLALLVCTASMKH